MNYPTYKPLYKLFLSVEDTNMNTIRVHKRTKPATWRLYCTEHGYFSELSTESRADEIAANLEHCPHCARIESFNGTRFELKRDMISGSGVIIPAGSVGRMLAFYDNFITVSFPVCPTVFNITYAGELVAPPGGVS